jgi:Uma2 family endonuclease
VIELWVIVPETRQVQIYRLQEQPGRPSAIYERTDVFESILLPGLRLEAAEIFAE